MSDINYATTIDEPPNVGSVTTYLPDNQPNRGSSSAVTGFLFLKHVLNDVTTQGYNDMQILQNNLPDFP